MIKTSITMWAPPVLFVGLSTNKYNVWGHHLVAISHIPGLACEARPAAGNDATGAPRVRHAHSGGRFGRYDLRQHLLLLCPGALFGDRGATWVRWRAWKFGAGNGQMGWYMISIWFQYYFYGCWTVWIFLDVFGCFWMLDVGRREFSEHRQKQAGLIPVAEAQTAQAPRWARGRPANEMGWTYEV